MNTFDGYIRRDGTNSKVLLDGGDAKALSSFIGTISYANNKITYTKADGTSYDLINLSNYIYNLGAATSDNLGGIKIGFSQSGKNYPVQLDANNKAYVYVPWEENSHYTTRLYVGDGTAENKVTTNGNTKITVTDNNNVRNYITLIGSGATNVSSDDNGKITINSTNTTYNTGDSAILNVGTNTEGKLWSAKTLVDYISDILGVDSIAITSLNTLIGLLHDNDTATGILVELAKKLNTPSSSIGSNDQPIYWNGSSFTTIGYTIEKSVPSNAIFTDTKYSFYVGENNNIKEHKNVSNPYFKLFENNTPTSIQIKAGTGISVSSDINGNITIKNESPDLNHNTDKTGIKLGTISGTKKTDSTVIINNSSTGLTIAGGTNKFSIGDGTNYIEIPITPSFTVTNKDSTIGTSLTTIATIAGTDIKAKIGSYLPLSGGTMTGHLTIKTSSYRDLLTIYRNENNNNSVINFSNKDGFLGAIGFTGLGQTGMPEKPHVVLKDGTVYTLLHSGNTSISNGTITINGNTITPITSLSGYATEQFVTNKLSSVLDIKIVTTLPTLNINTKTLYLMPAESTGTNDLYKEYVYINKGTSENPNWDWEILGTVHLNYSDLVTAISFSNNKLLWKKGSTDLTGITIGYATASSVINNTWERDHNCLIEFSNYKSLTRIFMYDANSTNSPSSSGWITAHGWLTQNRGVLLALNFDQGEAGRLYTNSQISDGLTGWTGWKKVAWISDIPTKVSLLTNDSGYLTSHLRLPDMIKRHTANNLFNDTAGLRVIIVDRDSTLLGSQKWGSVIQWSNANYSPSTVNSSNWYNQLMGLTDDRLYFRTRTNGGNWTNFHKVAWTSDIPTKSSWNYDDRYLKLSTGGTVLGTTTFKTDSYGTQLEIYINTNNGNPSIKFNNSNSITNRSIGFETSRNGDNAFYFTDNNATNKYYVASEEYVTSRGYLTSHYVTHLYAGSGSSANAITTNGNTKLTITDDSIVRNSITIKGSGSTSVTSDANGIITIDSSDKLVLQRLTSNDLNYPLLFSDALNNNTTVDVTNTIYRNNSIYANPSTGTITANKFNGSVLELYPGDVSNYTEGIRIHPSNARWTTLMFCGTDNTRTSGTSANSWSFHTYDGNLYINRNSANTPTVNRLWGHSNGYTIGNTTEGGYNFTVGGTSRFIDTTTTSHIIPAYDYTYNIGSNTAEYACTFSRVVYARHLNASGPYYNKDLYLGYYSTTNIQFYTTDAGGNNRKKIALFKQDGNVVFNNTVTASSFYSSSDIRLKNVISSPIYKVENFANLDLVKYTWKNKDDKVHLGSIAQSVEKEFPELVNTNQDGYKSLDYATFGAIGVISLAREIVELKKEIKELKSKLYG